MTDKDVAQIIIDEVCRFYNNSFEKINVKSRDRKLVEPRQVIMYFMKKYTQFSLKEIGAYFSKDYATIIYSIKTVINSIQVNKRFEPKIIIMAGRINFNMRQFDIRKNSEKFERQMLSIPQF